MTRHRILVTLLAPLILWPLLAGQVAAAVVAGSASATATPVPVPAASCESNPADSWLLYAPADRETVIGEGLIVADALGNEVRRVDVPRITYGIPTRSPGPALAMTEDDDIFVIDAVTASATRLDLPATARGEVFPASPPFWGTTGTDWGLLGSPQLDQALLVDLREGRVFDLAAAITATGDEFDLVLAGAIAPDDAHVLLVTGQRLYLIDTADPTRARRLAESGRRSFLPTGGFLDGGETLVYTRPAIAGAVQLVTEDLATGSTEAVLLAGGIEPPRSVFLRSLPDEQSILVFTSFASGRDGRLTLSIYDRGSKSQRVLARYPGGYQVVAVAPSGGFLLLGALAADLPTWLWVDTATGSAKPIRELTGLVAVAPFPTMRWMTFLPTFTVGRGTPGAFYKSFDLETGNVRDLLEQQETLLYQVPSEYSRDGRFAVLPTFRDDAMRLYLLDNAVGSTRYFDSPIGIGGRFSPDGCRLALGITSREEEDGPVRVQVRVVSLTGGPPITIPEAGQPFWAPG